ncbi:hypothetical protein MYXO_04020 [Myxococcaceae bacterium]|nr:hypothetical protein MYXO_04020 [Myxococcaceae bacterium]
MTGVRPDTKQRRARPIAALVLAVLLLPAPARAAGDTPGSYCPIPAPGEKPDCRAGAEERYPAFYQSLEAGSIDPAAAARIEADLASGGDVERSYEALSSLAYGYYVLARKASASPHADPAVVARLERWNELLARAYHESPPEASLRAAVREAAADIERRAAPVRVACTDANGNASTCTSTQSVLREMDAARDHTGLRGQLGRLMERLLGEDGDS